MRFYIFVLALIFTISPTAYAQQAEPTNSTRIEVDQDASVVRVIIEGKEVAQFTSSGLLVRDNIEYGGMIKDGGIKGGHEKMSAEAARVDEVDAP